MDNTAKEIREAIQASPALRAVSKVYLQGSYRNRVNVRADSDVDVGVLYTGSTFFSVLPAGVTREQVGIIDSNYTYKEFKDAIEVALVSRFGRAAVRRGDKAFDVNEGRYRVDADVVPTFVHRRYRSDRSYICGVEIRPDSGGRIPNWPERLFDLPEWPPQHYENGNAKNDATRRRYRGMVRILKTLRNRMEEEKIRSAKPIKGFLVECLIFNVPNGSFQGQSWTADLKAALAYLWSNTQADATCSDWTEVSRLIYLFRGDPKKREEANAFLLDAWSVVGIL